MSITIGETARQINQACWDAAVKAFHPDFCLASKVSTTFSLTSPFSTTWLEEPI